MEKLLNLDNDDWEISDGVLKKCWLLSEKEITVPDGVVEVAAMAFSNNFDACIINIPKSVKIIRWYAFESCKNLGEIHIGNPDVVLENKAVTGADNLEAIYIGDKKVDTVVTVDELNGKTFFTLDRYLGDDENIAIDSDIKEVEERAFKNNATLIRITFSHEVERIGDEAFKDCKELQEVELNQPLYSIGDMAFAGCVNIKELKLPITVFSIGNEAFDGWREDQCIFVPENVKKMSKIYKWQKGCNAKIIFY